MKISKENQYLKKINIKSPKFKKSIITLPNKNKFLIEKKRMKILSTKILNLTKIKLSYKKFNYYSFVFHATDENKELIVNFIKNDNLGNSQVISDENIKSQILSSSVFAVAKSGTISLEICNANIPSIIIYKVNMINYWIMKFLVKVKFANIINIINNKEVIPELLQDECNAKEIFNSVSYLLGHPDLLSSQLKNIKKTLKNIKSETSSTKKVSTILSQYL